MLESFVFQAMKALENKELSEVHTKERKQFEKKLHQYKVYFVNIKVCASFIFT